MKTVDEKNIGLNALSFDVEEHFQVSAFDSPLQRENWGNFESRVEGNTVKILELLNRANVKATFFVLGWVAERHANLIRRIARDGHEIGSHGYAHELITAQNPSQFREDVRRGKRILEDIIGSPVYGYRAPSFTITEKTKWAFPILVEEGHVYDSSVFPIYHDCYGMPNASLWHSELLTSSGPLWEVPLTTCTLLGVRVPIAGGGYFRLFPYSILRWMLRKTRGRGHQLILYFHPWEMDPGQPRMNGPLLSRFRHYLNIQKTEARFGRLLSDFSFGPICQVIEPIRMRVSCTADPVSKATAIQGRCAYIGS